MAGRLAEAEADARESLACAASTGCGRCTAALGTSRTSSWSASLPRHPRPVAGAGHALRFADRRYAFHGRGLVRAATGDPDGRSRTCGAVARPGGLRRFQPGGHPGRSSLAVLLPTPGDTRRTAARRGGLALARGYGANRAIGIALRAAALLRRGEAAGRREEEALAVLTAGPAGWNTRAR